MSEEKVFTQAEVDEIVQERVRRSKRQFEREMEEIRAEVTADLPDYKSIYFDYKAQYVHLLRQIKCLEAGVPIDQVEKYAKYIDAEDEKEIEEQARILAPDVSTKKEPTYADPGTKRKSIWNPWS